MDALSHEFLKQYARSLPSPEGSSSREIVRRAITFDTPPRIPYCFSIPFESDFFETAVIDFLLTSGNEVEKEPGDTYYDEWGVGQVVTGRGHDQSSQPPLDDFAKLGDYQLPALDEPGRFAPFAPFLDYADSQGKFIVANDPVSLFERSKQLVGFEKLMISLHAELDMVKQLLSRLTDLMISIVDQWTDAGPIDAFMIWDDWGLQKGLQISPRMFREIFRPFYKKLVDHVHAKGLFFFWHSCGDIVNIIEDMIDIGVDVVQLDQSRLMGHARLSDTFGGRICFWNTVDIQWSVEENRTESELIEEVKQMVAYYHRFNGGFMARHYPQPDDINLSHERNWMIYNAFMENGCNGKS